MDFYVLPQNRDTRWPLWGVRYEVRIPYIQTLDADEMENYGVRTSGDPSHDHATMWEPMLLNLPIHRLAEMSAQGASIRLVNPSDSVKIYNAIEDHLVAWKNHIENSFNPISVPENDLLILDQFASLVHEAAIPFFPNKWTAANFKWIGHSPHSRRAIEERISAMEAKAARERERFAETGDIIVKNIEIIKPVVAYKQRDRSNDHQVDYSGKEAVYDIPARIPMSALLKKRS